MVLKLFRMNNNPGQKLWDTFRNYGIFVALYGDACPPLSNINVGLDFYTAAVISVALGTWKSNIDSGGGFGKQEPISIKYSFTTKKPKCFITFWPGFSYHCAIGINIFHFFRMYKSKLANFHFNTNQSFNFRISDHFRMPDSRALLIGVKFLICNLPNSSNRCWNCDYF